MPERPFAGKTIEDPDTKKILDEMEAESKEGDQKPEDTEGGQKPEAKSGEGVKPEDKPEGAGNLKNEPPAKTDDSKKSEEEEAEDQTDEEDEEGDEPPARRPITMIPLQKHQDFKKRSNERIATLEKELEQYKAGKGNKEVSPENNEGEADIDKVAAEIANRRGLDADVVKDIMLGVIKITPKSSREDKEFIESVRAEQAQTKQNELFNNEFSQFTKRVPEAETLKGKIYNLAFTDTPIEIDGQKYSSHTLPVKILYDYLTEGTKAPAKKKTAESSRPAGQRKQEWDETTDISTLSDDEFAQFSEAMAKKQGGTINTIKHRYS